MIKLRKIKAQYSTAKITKGMIYDQNYINLLYYKKFSKIYVLNKINFY